jgi:hypothetical protein
MVARFSIFSYFSPPDRCRTPESGPPRRDRLRPAKTPVSSVRTVPSSATATWSPGDVGLRFAVSDLTLRSFTLRLLRRSAAIADPPLGASELSTLSFPDDRGFDGAVIWSQPVRERLPELMHTAKHLIYVPRQYERFYVDLTLGLEKYRHTFSGRSRSTLQRKVRKFSESSGGDGIWRTYRSKAEIVEFHSIARKISQLTYQERLLDAGLPVGDEFVDKIGRLAEGGDVLGYILFHRGHPVSYLLLPIENKETVLYAYVGFDPSYKEYSPGTVLLWLVLQELQAAATYRIFDFTEGEGEHKRLFSTNSCRSADIFVLRRNAGNLSLVYSHSIFCRTVESLGRLLSRSGFKRRIKRWLRRQ